jgi:hypothetical protein
MESCYYTGTAEFEAEATRWKSINGVRAREGITAWDGVLLEEVFEALAETDPAKLRTELVQVAAVIVNWLEDIDSRTAPLRPVTVGEAIIALVPGAEGAGIKP